MDIKAAEEEIAKLQSTVDSLTKKLSVNFPACKQIEESRRAAYKKLSDINNKLVQHYMLTGEGTPRPYIMNA